jgi:hypothetical protein
MKWLRNWAIHTAAISVTLTFIASCGAAPDSTGPGASPTITPRLASVPTNVVARSELVQPGWAGFAPLSGPTIEVFDQYAKPMAGVSVTFKITRGGGSIGQSDTVTNQYGYARTLWILGEQGGSNTLLVTVGGIDSLSFEADAKVQAIVARYDLSTIGGLPLPLYYSGGGSSWVITGGHFVIAADNSYAWGYDVAGIPGVRPLGSVVWVNPTTVQFFQAPGTYPASQFYQDRNGLFATGKIDGNVMTVTYEDPIDFDNEIYLLSGK